MIKEEINEIMEKEIIRLENGGCEITNIEIKEYGMIKTFLPEAQLVL